MTTDGISPDKLPFLKHVPTDGRLIPTYPFFDDIGKWHLYIKKSSDGTLLDIQPVNPVSSSYLGKVTVDPRSDVLMPLSNAVAQHFSFGDTFGVLKGVERDYLNAFAVLHKYFILLEHAIQHKALSATMLVSFDLEFSLSNHRAFYDLLNKLLLTLYSRFRILDAAGRPLKPEKLPDSFHRVVEKKPGDLATKFHFPQPLIDFYQERAALFLRLCKIRDNIVHHGHTPDMVFVLDDGFAVCLDDPIWRDLDGLDIWPDILLKPNRLGSVLGILVFLLQDMETAALGLADSLLRSFPEPPVALMGEYRVFLRDPLLIHQSRLGEYRNTHWYDPSVILRECDQCWEERHVSSTKQ